MKGLPLEKDYPPFPPSPNNPTNEGVIGEFIGLDMEIVDPLDCQEGMIETIEKVFISPSNPSLIDRLGPPLAKLPSSNPYLDQMSIFHQ